MPIYRNSTYLATVDGREIRVGRYFGPNRASFPLCFTPRSLHCLMHTVGRLPAETGAKAFCLVDRFGIEVVEFDRRGSRNSSYGLYRPDADWGEARCQYHLDQPEARRRLWVGDAHSHPGSRGIPSRPAGRGLGDLGYAEQVFAANESMEFFSLPILTGMTTGVLTIHPWLCRRAEPLELLIADVRVCAVADFPTRIFNPVWEKSLTQVAQSDGSDVNEPIAADELRRWLPATRVQVESEACDSVVKVARGGVLITATCRGNFPQSAPDMTVQHGNRRPIQIDVPWAAVSVHPGAERLARACEWLFDGHVNQF